jgi:hypothetical protein
MPLENRDSIVVARTGIGKSKIFAITAIAARLSGLKGPVIVVAPLKALEEDLVGRFAPVLILWLIYWPSRPVISIPVLMSLRGEVRTGI